VIYILDVRPKNSPAVREQPTFIEAARRKQIIEAATETIAELGFVNASLAQIAKRAGISKSVIGYYFPTKDDLVKQAVDHFYLTGHVSMMGQMEHITSASEALRIYIHSNIDYVHKNRTATMAMGEIVTNFRGPDGLPVYKYEDTEPMIEGTKALFDWGQQTGEFRLFDSRVMAVTLRGAMDSFAAELKANPTLDASRYAAELTALFISAAVNPVTPSLKVGTAPTQGGTNP
jgi:AcrR family transcriptional regulator